MFRITYFSDGCVNDSKKGYLGDLSGSIDITSLNHLGTECLEKHICISSFNNLKRSTEHLIENRLMTFDFDSGKTFSKDVHEMLLEQNVVHIILGSKNHLKDKNDGKGIIERFHVFIPLKKSYTVDDRDFWKWSWKKINKDFNWDSDTSCNDLCRYYYKHSSVLYKGGKNLFDLEQWRGTYAVYRALEESAQQEREKKRLETLQRFGSATEDEIDTAIQIIINNSENSVENNNGDKTLFLVCCKIIKYGGQFRHIKYYNDYKCSPKWTEKQLKHKWEKAMDKVKKICTDKITINRIISGQYK